MLLRARPKLEALLAGLLVALLAPLPDAAADPDKANPEAEPALQQPSFSTLIEGWTQVSSLWPVRGAPAGYFVADSKGMHTVEASLPRPIEADLLATFRYFYNFRRFPPKVTVSLCDGSYSEILQERPGEWHTHQVRMRRADCQERPHLAYNIILQEDNVFAWSSLEVSLEPASDGLGEPPTWPPSADMSPPATTTTVEPSSTTSSTSTSAQPETATPASTSAQPETATPTTTITTTDRPSSQVRPFFGYEDYPAALNTESAPPADRAARAKRSAEHGALLCAPANCDAHIFRYTEFRALASAMPDGVSAEALEQNQRVYLSERAASSLLTSIKLEPEASLEKLDVCMSFQLYLDPRTSVELQLETETGDRKSLELFQSGEQQQQQAAGWRTITRCLSNYMPSLKPSQASADSVKLHFLAKEQPEGRRILARMDSQAFVSLKASYPMNEFVPDVSNYAAAQDADRYWIFGSSQAQRPELELEEPEGGETGRKTRRLRIYNIHDDGGDGGEQQQQQPAAAAAATFDIVSRWIYVDDLTPADSSLVLVYKPLHADWIESVEVSSQESQAPAGAWKQLISFPALKRSSSAASPTTRPAPEEAGAPRRQASLGGADSRAAQQYIPIAPIKLKGVLRNEFRIRLRHRIRRAPAAAAAAAAIAAEGQPQPKLELLVEQLALGDACAPGSYCRNNATCKPIKPNLASCACLPGYSGHFCEKSQPCEMLFGAQTGAQLCHSIGARCEPALPVLRCTWPDDQFYTCRALFTVNAEGHYEPLAGDRTPAAAAAAAGPDGLAPGGESWRERADSQSRLVIILSVFLIALLAFSVVIVANLAKRLVRSRRHFKGAQVEMLQVQRRQQQQQQPSTSTAGLVFSAPAASASAGRHRLKPAGAVSYTNQSFDAD